MKNELKRKNPGSILWVTGFERSVSPFILDDKGGNELDRFCCNLVSKIEEKCRESDDSYIFKDENSCCLKNRNGIVMLLWGNNISQEEIEREISRKSPDKVIIFRHSNTFNKGKFMKNVADMNYSFVTMQMPQYNLINVTQLLRGNNDVDSVTTDPEMVRPDNTTMIQFFQNSGIIKGNIYTDQDILNDGVIEGDIIYVKDIKDLYKKQQGNNSKFWKSIGKFLLDYGMGKILDIFIGVALGACPLLS